MSTDDPPKSKQSQRQVLQSLYDVSWCCERFYRQMTLKSLEFRIRNTPLCLFFFLVSKEMIRVSQLRLRKLRKRVKKKKKKKNRFRRIRTQASKTLPTELPSHILRNEIFTDHLIISLSVCHLSVKVWLIPFYCDQIA